MGWKYGGKPVYITGDAARWLNFWMLIGIAFIIIFCLIAANDSDIEANPILGVLSLFGLISFLVTPFMLFISLLGGGTCMYGLPEDFWEPFRKIKKKGEPIHEPLQGYEDCSPQFQAYMRKQGKKNDQKLLISEFKE